MRNPSVTELPVMKVNASDITEAHDVLAAEEPLEIRLDYFDGNARVQKSISVTMRTPGSDFELATGFLFTEGIIRNAHETLSVTHCNGLQENVVSVKLSDEIALDMTKLHRHFYTSSSCGVCGKSSIEAVRTISSNPVSTELIQVTAGLIYSLPDALRRQQEVFDKTGGLHASALFDADGKLLFIREDVGRHNALDKMIGAALREGMIPLDKHVLLLSGRASFELIQKASMAGIPVVAAIGAPSSLAVQMAEESGITLIGFLRGERFNIYSGAQRVII